MYCEYKDACNGIEQFYADDDDDDDRIDREKCEELRDILKSKVQKFLSGRGL